MSKKVQINPNIDKALKKRLSNYADKRGIPYSQVVEAAIYEYFNDDSEKTREAILLRRVDELNRRLENLAADCDVLGEAFALFIRNYLARLPDVPQEQVKAFIARKEKKFNDYIEALSDSVKRGNTLINRMPRDVFISDEEGEAMLDVAKQHCQAEAEGAFS